MRAEDFTPEGLCHEVQAVPVCRGETISRTWGQEEELGKSPTQANAVPCLQQHMDLFPCGEISVLCSSIGSQCPTYIPVTADAGVGSTTIFKIRQHWLGTLLLFWCRVIYNSMRFTCSVLLKSQSYYGEQG